MKGQAKDVCTNNVGIPHLIPQHICTMKENVFMKVNNDCILHLITSNEQLHEDWEIANPFVKSVSHWACVEHSRIIKDASKIFKVEFISFGNCFHWQPKGNEWCGNKFYFCLFLNLWVWGYTNPAWMWWDLIFELTCKEIKPFFTALMMHLSFV